VDDGSQWGKLVEASEAVPVLCGWGHEFCATDIEEWLDCRDVASLGRWQRRLTPVLATATDWKNMSSYTRHKVELFLDLGAAGTEDQFVYMDDDGNYHAVFHHMYGTGTKTQWWLDATGGHAFSRNGWEWTYTGVSWGNATSRYNTKEGQGAFITFSDGTTTRFTRLERPHLIFKTNQMVGDPIFLTNSAQYGNSTNPEGASANGDACYTLVRPINQGE
jgi:hypothetical protein